MTNRLAHETSPYLLQHKDNPVDWYPWGTEALERARREDKPILLSIGYAACHWCHVMEHESFEDPETAAVMNEHFVCIKVDREERPDIDAIYMDAVQRLTGHGGWPMTMFLTPEGVPFEGGTYFPKEQRHGLPAFTAVLHAIARVWKEKRPLVEEQGRRLLENLDVMSQLRASDEVLTDAHLLAAFDGLKRSFDPANGGFGGPMKFPQPMTLDFLMRMRARGIDSAGEMLKTTLDAMANGGIFDQLGGGFHRYAVDPQWVVPHFEKMLYDNALLLRTYARDWAVTGDPRRREIAEATAAWMLNEMRDPSGGFWSSLDADSEGEEGKFYVWDLDEVQEVVGEDFDAAAARFGLTRTGNFEGANIPVAAQLDVARDEVERARTKLMERRSERVRPAADDKVLTGWNALAVAALAEAGRLMNVEGWIAAARDAMSFIFSELEVDGRLMRSFRKDPERGSSVRHLAYCEDYAFVLEACMALYEATADGSWLDKARRAADESIRLFADEETGGFFSTGIDAEPLVTRPKDLVDNAIPSANSVLALELQRLAEFTGENAYRERAVAILRLVHEAMVRSPGGFAHALCALDFHVSGAREIVIVGDTLSEAAALAKEVRARYFPNAVLVVAAASDEAMEKKVPLLAGRTTTDGKPTAYVCRNGTCRLPVTSAEELLRELAA